MKFYTAGRDAMAKLGLEITPEMERVEPTYPVYLNDYYLGLIDPADWRNDPIARQSLPDPQELADLSSSYDPLAEEEQMPTPHLIHRFVDRVVLLDRRVLREGTPRDVLSSEEFRAAFHLEGGAEA